jgi:hypothetical protein
VLSGFGNAGDALGGQWASGRLPIWPAECVIFPPSPFGRGRSGVLKPPLFLTTPEGEKNPAIRVRTICLSPRQVCSDMRRRNWKYRHLPRTVGNLPAGQTVVVSQTKTFRLSRTAWRLGETVLQAQGVTYFRDRIQYREKFLAHF